MVFWFSFISILCATVASGFPCRIKSHLILFTTVRPCVCHNCFKFKVRASSTKRTKQNIALFVYDMVFKPLEAFFPRWIKSSLSLSALINLTAFLFTGTFNFGHFSLVTLWHLVICKKSALSLQSLQEQGGRARRCARHAILVWRRLGKKLTIKRRVWDQALFTIDMQDKSRRQKMIDLFLL